MADIGYIALLLALAASIYSAIAFIFGAKWGRQRLVESAKKSLLACFVLVSLSAISLLYLLLTHNFRVEYVFLYTSRNLPLPYLISAFWAGNEGSLLLWAWLLSIFAAVVVIQRRDVGRELLPYASSIIMLILAFFLLLLSSVSNPFRKLPIAHSDGMGLNPLLKDVAMIFHPPALLAGYVGFSVPFSFAIASLIKGRVNTDDWIMGARRLTILSWLLLGVGNLLGAWWAYRVLGWGGYWAWDPVENAGLMPWLTATAFLHSTTLQRRKGMFKIWNLSLIITTFILTIFGTFLTRSGIISSVHAFAQSALGPFFLSFIGIALFGSLGLLFRRYKDIKGEAKIEALISKESSFLLNNMLLVGATFIIFVGTVFPLISEVMVGERIIPGPSFFNRACAPILLSIVFLGGACVPLGWKRMPIGRLMRGFLLPSATTSILAIILFASGIRVWYAFIAFLICGFVISAIFSEIFRETRARHQTRAENYFKAFWNLIRLSRSRYGGYIIHISIAVIAIGVTGSSLFSVEKEAKILPGQSMSIKGYNLVYEGIDVYKTQDEAMIAINLSAYKQGELIGRLVPEKHFYFRSQQLTTNVAIHSSLLEDLYVIPLHFDKDDAVALKVLVNPLVSWIWIGGWIFIFGGLIAFWPEKKEVHPGLSRRN